MLLWRTETTKSPNEWSCQAPFEIQDDAGFALADDVGGGLGDNEVVVRDTKERRV